MKYSEPSSVGVRHWCEPTPGQPSRMIERVGKDHASAIAAWNTREAPAQPAADDKAGWEAIAKLRRTEFGSENNRKSATHIDTLVPLDVLNALPDGTLLYTRPQPQADQPAERVALKKDQREALLDSVDWYNFPQDLIIATEMKHGITAKDQS